MNAQLTILRGSRAGAALVLSRADVTVGRHPDADLRFDPERDLKMSARHAVLFRVEEAWYVRDLGSRNGTLVNGQPIRRDTRLQEGDRVEFGEGGPLVEFHLLPRVAASEPAFRPPRPPSTQPAFPPLGSTPKGTADRGSEGGQSRASVREQVARETRRLRYVIALLGVALATVTTIAILVSRAQRTRWETEVASMEARIDSILESSANAEAILEGRVAGLRDALARSQVTLRDLRTRMASAEARGDSAEIRGLRLQLQQAQVALRRHELAANIDYQSIEAANRPAIAKVYVQFEGGEVFTATAFAVRPDATLLTNRHVVAGERGTRTPLRLGVQFADSEQVWPARVVASARDADVAVIKVDNIQGVVPTVHGLNSRPDTVQPGSAVALIGYPLGGGDPEGGRVARTTTTAGIVHSSGPDLLRVSGYGVEGSSGSPVLDSNGEVIAVLFGGRETDGDRLLVAVPATRAIELLRAVDAR